MRDIGMGGQALREDCSPYIVERQRLLLPELPASCQQLHFAEAAFRPSLFRAYGMTCPFTLSGSAASRRAEFLAGRLAARYAAAEAGLSLGQVGIGHYRQPLWPAGVTGSIAHDRQRAVAAISRGGADLGIDILPELDAPTAQLLAPQVITPAEASLLRDQLPHSQPWSLALAFSAKECLYKALFPRVGRIFDFLDVELCSLSPAEGRLQLRLTTALGAGTAPGQAFEVRWLAQAWGDLTYCALQ